MAWKEEHRTGPEVMGSILAAAPQKHEESNAINGTPFELMSDRLQRNTSSCCYFHGDGVAGIKKV